MGANPWEGVDPKAETQPTERGGVRMGSGPWGTRSCSASSPGPPRAAPEGVSRPVPGLTELVSGRRRLLLRPLLLGAPGQAAGPLRSSRSPLAAALRPGAGKPGCSPRGGPPSGVARAALEAPAVRN